MPVPSHPLPQLPSIQPSVDDVRALMRDPLSGHPLRNPHPEKPVSEAVRARARSSAVLLPIVKGPEPAIIVTRRHARIRFAGHICFPGGTHDEGDESLVKTALRETEEEIALPASDVEVLGSLGEYVTQAGYRITPVVGLVDDTGHLTANPDEVEEIYEVPLAHACNTDNYAVTWHNTDRGHLACHFGEVRIAGPTLSILLNFYERLCEVTPSSS